MTYDYEHKVGRNADGETLKISLRIDVAKGEHQTIEHDVVTDPAEVGLMGSITKGRRDVGGGQCYDALLEVVDFATGWDRAKAVEVHGLWKRWHLNTMRAACAHQTVVWEQGQYGRQPSLDLTPQCEASGYRYGHAWLTEVVPPEVIARLNVLLPEKANA